MASWGRPQWNQTAWNQQGAGPPPGLSLGALQNRVSQRLDEGLIGATFYPLVEITAKLNEAYRFFVLLTLGLESTVTFPLAKGTTFYHMLATFPDWILPLRIYNPDGSDVRPAKMEDLDSLDANWTNTPGSPIRYVALGFDVLAFYRQPARSDLSVQITYAQSPADLVQITDVPLIPAEYHPSLVDYAIYALRQKEGGQEFAKTMTYFHRFLDDAQEYGDYVRARNLGNRYEQTPFELRMFDRSRLASFRPELAPLRRKVS